jgi:thiol:disulfide interchange protein DsbD
VFPAPKRLVSAGGILDHVYEKHLTLAFSLEVPADAAPGSEVKIEASPEWLVCHDVCLPGSADLSLKLIVAKSGEQPTAGPKAALFAKAREKTPKPLPKDSPVRISAAKGKATITAPDASELAFYPGPRGVHLPNAVKEGAAKGDTLVLKYESEIGKPDMLQGILEVTPRAGGTPKLWAIQADLVGGAGVNKPAGEPSNHDPRDHGDK